MDEFVHPGGPTAHDSVLVFHEFYFLTLKRDMMIRNVRYSRNFFSFITVLVPTYLYLKVQCNNFFFQLISCFGKGDTIGRRYCDCERCYTGAYSKDKYLSEVIG